MTKTNLTFLLKDMRDRIILPTKYQTSHFTHPGKQQTLNRLILISSQLEDAFRG
jgi:hypothetical protein